MPADRQRTEQICVRMTKRERAQLEAKAKRERVSVCELLMRPWRKGEK